MHQLVDPSGFGLAYYTLGVSGYVQPFKITLSMNRMTHITTYTETVLHTNLATGFFADDAITWNLCIQHTIVVSIYIINVYIHAHVSHTP
jgi:hypothetical protein